MTQQRTHEGEGFGNTREDFTTSQIKRGLSGSCQDSFTYRSILGLLACCYGRFLRLRLTQKVLGRILGTRSCTRCNKTPQWSGKWRSRQTRSNGGCKLTK